MIVGRPSSEGERRKGEPGGQGDRKESRKVDGLPSCLRVMKRFSDSERFLRAKRRKLTVMVSPVRVECRFEHFVRRA